MRPSCRLEFLTEEDTRIASGDFLNEPSNARRLFDSQAPVGEGEASGGNARAPPGRMG